MNPTCFTSPLAPALRAHLARQGEGAAPGGFEICGVDGGELLECLDLLQTCAPSALRLREVSLSAEQLGALADSGVLAPLQRFALDSEQDMPFCGCEAAAVSRLTKALTPGRLERLCLFNCGLSAPGIEALCRSEVARGLTALALGQEPLLDSRGLAALCGENALTNLRELCLYCCDVSKGDLGELASSRLLRKLEELNLCDTGAGAAFWAKALEAPGLPALRSLDANQSDFGDEQAVLLARATWATKLELLDLYFTPIKTSSIVKLLKAKHLPVLRLKACVADIQKFKRSRLGSSAERFVAGMRYDCGSVSWPHWRILSSY